ncbi:MAG: hypothetical protein ACOC7K_01365 [bacterium]
MDCEYGIGELIHVLLFAQNNAAGPERQHVSADLITTRAMILFAVFPQPLCSAHWAVDFFIQDMLHPRFLV